MTRRGAIAAIAIVANVGWLPPAFAEDPAAPAPVALAMTTNLLTNVATFETRIAGSAFCASGRIAMGDAVPTDASVGIASYSHVIQCDDGDTIAIRFRPLALDNANAAHDDPAAVFGNGIWKIVGGTGRYAGLRGEGDAYVEALVRDPAGQTAISAYGHFVGYVSSN